ncbi:MAG: aminopeptidase [Lachnospiraceae bacterium]|nr:aminopeptidase [Lachnospiraceae bacterium]
MRIEEEELRERALLAAERIREIANEEIVKEPYRDYFRRTARFLVLVEETAEREPKTLEECQEENRLLYEDISGSAYEKSYGNPAYAVRNLGDELGGLLSFVYAELRAGIILVREERFEEWVSLSELFLELYQLFCQVSSGESEEASLPGAVREAVYYFESDYCERRMDYRVREQLDPTLDFARRIVMEADLSELTYLYRYGEYISQNELRISSYLDKAPEEMVEQIAVTFTEGYRKGFVNAGKNLAGKKTVNIRYPIGFERVIRRVIEKFLAMGLEPILYRAAVLSVDKKQHMKIGYCATPANLQYDYDHRLDEAWYLDKAFEERKLSALRAAYERRKEWAAVYGGPAVFETFGEAPFIPERKEEAASLSGRQKKLSVSYRTQAGEITERYLKRGETSFTIISFPIPEIGERFPEIFRETAILNTLDSEIYRRVQERLIEALDRAERVHIEGKAPNRTDLWVSLMPLEDPSCETRFENCLADVNIPLGEVFTSPVLAGTNGRLHVSDIYIEGLRYRDLELVFRDGMTTEVTCKNEADENANAAFVRENILYHHESLPMGEFAIGTNTAAYAMAKKYAIMDRMKILIIEKMGPHFAVGDTCYSREEDRPVYNPDKKEVIARDNEVSRLRKSEPSKAYFHCHTDITLPYEEVGRIAAWTSSGEEIRLIEDGRFVLPGTELLNKALGDIG